MNLLKKIIVNCNFSILRSQKGIAPLVIIVAVAIMTAAVPTTVILVQQEQDNRQSAAGESIERCTSNSRNDAAKVFSLGPEETFYLLHESGFQGDINVDEIKNTVLTSYATAISQSATEIEAASVGSAALMVGMITQSPDGKVIVTSVNGLVAEADNLDEARELLRLENLKNPYYRQSAADLAKMSEVKTMIQGAKYEEAAKLLDDYAGRMGANRAQLIDHINKTSRFLAPPTNTLSDINEVMFRDGSRKVFTSRTDFIRYVDESKAVTSKALSIASGISTVDDKAVMIVTQAKGAKYAKLVLAKKIGTRIAILSWVGIIFEVLTMGPNQSSYLGCTADQSGWLNLTLTREPSKKWTFGGPHPIPEGTICKYKGSSCIEFVSGNPLTATPTLSPTPPEGPIQDPNDTCFDPTGGGLQFECFQGSPSEAGWTKSRDKTCATGTGTCYWYAPPSTKKTCAETYIGSNATCVPLDIKCSKTIYEARGTLCENQGQDAVCCGNEGGIEIQPPTEPPQQDIIQLTPPEQKRILKPTATPKPIEWCREDGDQGQGQGCCSNSSCQPNLKCTGSPTPGGLRCCPANTYWDGSQCASSVASCQSLTFSCVPNSTKQGEQCCSPQFACDPVGQRCIENTAPTSTPIPNATATPTPVRPTSPPTPTVVSGQEACYAFGGQNGCTAWCQRSGGGGLNSYCDATCSSCLQVTDGSPSPTVADSCAVFGSHAACNTWCQSSPRNANGCNTDCNGCY